LTGKRPTQMTPRSQTNRISRRGLLQSSAALATALALPKALLLGPDAYAAGKARQHGLSIFGTFKYEPDFAHFGYVNPAAPKGGVFSQVPSSWAFNQNPVTFNSLNTLVQRGDAAVGLLVIYDSLMVRALDEPDAMYGLVAKDVSVSADGLVFTFALAPRSAVSRWHTADGGRCRVHAHQPQDKGPCADPARVAGDGRGPGDRRSHVEVRFTENATRSLPQFVAGLPIVSKGRLCHTGF
jgi:microcin C transport system substrate-binding protein